MALIEAHTAVHRPRNWEWDVRIAFFDFLGAFYDASRDKVMLAPEKYRVSGQIAHSNGVGVQ